MKKVDIKNRENIEKGVTLISLVITIILLIILAGIVIYNGKDTIKRAQLEELKTNMLLIQAKAREYVEDVNFKIGIDASSKSEDEKNQIRKEVYEDKARLEYATSVPSKFGITDTTSCYWLTEEAQENWGLDKIELDDDEKYLIQFDEINATVEVYNTKGYESQYKLSVIEQIQE